MHFVIFYEHDIMIFILPTGVRERYSSLKHSRQALYGVYIDPILN